MILKLIPIEVECHSGYKADEYPKCFTFDNKIFEISEITDRWYQGETDPAYPAANYYKVMTNVGKQFIIKHEMESDKWFICR